ncbi:MAG: hypothetical protein ABIE70_07000 [bacterium]
MKSPEHLQDLISKKFPGATMPTKGICGPVFRTGLKALDTIFHHGGIPFGQLIEITGDISSGKTSLAFKLLASLTRTGNAAYVDYAQTFFPPSAIAAGVNIDRLWLLRPLGLTAGFRSAELLVKHGAVRGVIIDLVGHTKLSKPLSPTMIHRLRQQAARSKVMIIFLTENTLSPTRIISPSTVSLRLETHHLAGGMTEVTITKSRLCREGISIEVKL